MRRLLRHVVASAKVGGPDADAAAGIAVDDGYLVVKSSGLTAAVVAKVEKTAPS